MFFDFNRKDKRFAFAAITVISFVVLSAILGFSFIRSEGNVVLGILRALAYWWHLKLLGSTVIGFLLVYLFDTSLDIEAKRVGHGQHGSASFMQEKEIREAYRRVPYGTESQPAILVGQDAQGWLIDESDNNLLLLAPPGGGKTKRIYIPSIYYNAQVNKNTAGKGASMVIMDIKGELYRSCNQFLKECGYRAPVLNFRDIAQSSRYQLLYKVNRAMDQYLLAEDPGQRSIYYGQAERFAKVLASSIVDNIDSASKSEASDYFNETAKGLLTGIILLVSEYALPDERHIISVFSLILEMNGQVETANPRDPQISKLDIILAHVTNSRIRNYTGAATSADIRTLMNVFSSALSKLTKFIDAELEQLVCDHSPDLSDIDFIKSPTAIFIVCPDENTTRHFFASLFIRFFSNDLIEQAENVYNGILPRQVLFFCDEFGNLPPIQDVDVLFAAIRSRGVRILISLQSYNQLYKAYSRERAGIIKDTCQMVMSGFVSPSSHETAKQLSEMLGNETVLTGSTSRGRSAQTTQSMVGRPLVAQSDWVTLPRGTFIVQKGGFKPLKSEMEMFFNYLKIDVQQQEAPPNLEYVHVHVADSRKIVQHLRGLYVPLSIGMFD